MPDTYCLPFYHLYKFTFCAHQNLCPYIKRQAGFPEQLIYREVYEMTNCYIEMNMITGRSQACAE